MACRTCYGVGMRLLRRHLPPPVSFPVEGTCPFREHTADGDYVGRCDFPLYGGVCGRHGRIPSDFALRDDRLLPDRRQRDYGDASLRAWLVAKGHSIPDA